MDCVVKPVELTNPSIFHSILAWRVAFMRITPRKRIGLVLAELLDDLFLQALQTSTTRRI